MAAGVAGGTALGVFSLLIFPCCLPCAVAACVVPAVSAATLAQEPRCRKALFCACVERHTAAHGASFQTETWEVFTPPSPGPWLPQFQGRLYQVRPMAGRYCLAATALHN